MSKKLLLADDSVTIQKVMQITFAHEDYELTITGDGDEAFQKALEVKPDLVLADVYMPGKNGYELCAALKRNPGCQGVPVLLLAGSFEPFDEGKARAAGADAWLEKPFESQTLLDKVAELLAAAPVAPQEAPAPAAEPVFPGPFPEVSAEVEEDHFGTISFDEELPGVDQQNVEIADDWGDFDDISEVESSPAASRVASADVEGGGEIMAEGDFSFEDEPLDESLVAGEETFVFEDEPVEEASPAAAISPDVFADSDDEIMALNDDDILGSEDLEPLEEEPTLSAWSREDFAMEETLDDDALFEPTMEDSSITAEPVPPAPEPAPPFAEAATPFGEEATPFEEEVAAFDEDAPPFVGEASPFAEESTSAVDEDASFTEEIATFEEAPAFVEQVATFEEEAPAFVAEVSDLEPAAFAEPGVEAIEDAPQFAAETFVEEQVGRLSEAELEVIVERVAGKVLERLAERILERVAWEVVPDLAEALIKEEISKIKEAAA